MKVVILVCFILLAQIGCSSTASIQPIEQSSEPQLVFSLTGSGDTDLGISTKTTQSFHISKNEWFIETSCSALDPTLQVFFSAAVYPKGELMDDNPVGIALQTTPGTATNYIHKAGDFYLAISAMNVKEWSIKVYQ